MKIRIALLGNRAVACREAQISAPAKRVKKTRKIRATSLFLLCFIRRGCGRVLHHLPASNRPGNYVRCSRLQAAGLA
jgi:hypothetical protein